MKKSEIKVENIRGARDLRVRWLVLRSTQTIVFGETSTGDGNIFALRKSRS